MSDTPMALETLRAKLPASEADMNEQQLMILAQITAIRTIEKEEVRQRGIENLCKLLGLYTQEKPIDEAAENKQLQKDLKRLVVQEARKLHKGIKVGRAFGKKRPGAA